MQFSIKGDSGKGEAGFSYEIALRVIGQDLTPLFIESLEITVQDKVVVAQARCIGDADEAVSEKRKGLLQKARRSLAFWKSKRDRAPERPSPKLLVRRYGVEDILRLDGLASVRQSSAQEVPDASSLAESLRSVGREVDSNGGRLISLSKDRHKVAFVYEDETGKAHREERYSLSLYRSQQEALARRGKGKKGDIWGDTR